MSIQKKLIVYIVSLLFACGAVIAGAMYLIYPLYSGISHQAALLSSLNGIIFVITVSGGFVLLCTVIYAFVMAALVTRNVTPPLKLLVTLAEEIRKGNLDCRVEYVKGDEFEPVFREFDSMREKLKNSLAETAAMEENRREMIACLAHDIKTPVTSICAYAEGLRDGIAQGPETRLRYVETILEKARLVDNLVNDLFLFSKLDVRQDSLTLQEVNAAGFFSGVFEEAAKNDLYTLDCEINGLDNETVMINETAFTRVIQNITQNSVCHSGVDNVSIRVTVQKNGGKILIRIADNGAGMDQGLCEHVFDRFYRADKSRAGSGSGLGLPICRRLILAMKGKIWARSGIAEGFAICISLPVENSGEGIEKNIDC